MRYTKATKSLSTLFLLGIAVFGLTSCGTKTSGKKSSTLKEEIVKEKVQQANKKSLTNSQEEKSATTSQEGNLIISEKSSISTEGNAVVIEKKFIQEEKIVKPTAVIKKMQLTKAGYDLLCTSLREKDMQTSRQEIMNRLPEVIAEVNEHLGRVMGQNGDPLTQSEFDVLVVALHGLKNKWWQEAAFVKVLQDPYLDPQTKRKLSASLLFLFVMDRVDGKREFIPGLAKRNLVESNILVASTITNSMAALAKKKATVYNTAKNLTAQLGIEPAKFPSHEDNLQLADSRWEKFISQNKQRIKQGQNNLLREAENIYQVYWKNLNSAAGSKFWKLK